MWICGSAYVDMWIVACGLQEEYIICGFVCQQLTELCCRGRIKVAPKTGVQFTRRVGIILATQLSTQQLAQHLRHRDFKHLEYFCLNFGQRGCVSH